MPPTSDAHTARADVLAAWMSDATHDREGARVVAAPEEVAAGPHWRAYCPEHLWAGPWRLIRRKAVEDVIEHGA